MCGRCFVLGCVVVVCDDDERRDERRERERVIDVIGSWSAQAGSLAYSVKSVESQKILTSLSLALDITLNTTSQPLSN